MNTRTRTLLAALPLVAALGLAGCADSADDGGSMAGMDHGSSTHSETAAAATPADIMFVTMMIPHHEQAVEMADLVLAKDGVDPRVVAIAERAQAAQAPEIERMQGWLAEWGVDPGAAESGMDHGDGMMSEDDMTALEQADGATAGRLFLEQMVVHHEGAVDMAAAALADAKDVDVRDLAQQVIDDQTAEIAEMQQLADSL
ncbi:DUF305 domain-containing protein [Microbacterium sp. NEAU-LLC]|uniref:DUF305 domain-containing protein n=1 Tax=Microbacterium helvum TaxID=2773713 RepID=A0ABR8NMC5_9MICO|nr:DUF305 domain-containing protein [Microbacterium helvum]MBD3941068.1 DUF305 domain-containing protein [Microbacterium helvum]